MIREGALRLRENVRRFVRLVAETLPTPEPIYEFGAWQRERLERNGGLRSLFPGKEYVGCDVRPGPGVDRILNVNYIDLPARSAGTVLMIDSLQYVEFPRAALDEILRVLRLGGLLVLTSSMNQPLLPERRPDPDYWRFTPDALRSLLSVFPRRWVGSAGNPTSPHTVLGLGFTGRVDDSRLTPFLARYREWLETDSEL